jgi:hypothetical protein
MIGGKPAARMGDQCAHGGTIVLGCPTVLIGEVSPGGAGGGGAGGGMSAANSGGLAAMPAPVIENVMKDANPEVAEMMTQVLALKEAAEHGTALVHNPDTCEICAAKRHGGSA